MSCLVTWFSLGHSFWYVSLVTFLIQKWAEKPFCFEGLICKLSRNFRISIFFFIFPGTKLCTRVNLQFAVCAKNAGPVNLFCFPGYVLRFSPSIFYFFRFRAMKHAQCVHRCCKKERKGEKSAAYPSNSHVLEAYSLIAAKKERA